MTLLIDNDISTNNIMNSVREISNVDVSTCLQCKKCTNGCAVVKLTDLSPSEIIRYLQLNKRDKVLNSDLIWMCASCEICYARCPMKIDMAAVMDALRILAAKRSSSLKNGKVKKMNRAFLQTVKVFGRTYDLGMIISFKMKSMSLFQDIIKFPVLLVKKKIALFPSFAANRTYTKRIFKTLKKKNK